MRGVRSKDTSIELIIRRALFRAGYRYRLHVKKLPGAPDIVFPGRKKVIFVHGCFWHQHEGCSRAKFPASNTDYWMPKLRRNADRDRNALKALQRMGWKSLVIWECELTRLEQAIKKTIRFLER